MSASAGPAPRAPPLLARSAYDGWDHEYEYTVQVYATHLVWIHDVHYAIGVRTAAAQILHQDVDAFMRHGPPPLDGRPGWGPLLRDLHAAPPRTAIECYFAERRAGRRIGSFPIRHGTETIGAATDLQPLVAAALARDVPRARGGPFDAIEWVDGLYGRLIGYPQLADLGGALAALLVDEQPVLRAGALCFFGQHPAAPGAGRVAAAAVQRPELFRGAPDPSGVYGSLADQLAHALGRRLELVDAAGRPTDAAALAAARAAALEPAERWTPLLDRLIRYDRVWVDAHLERISRTGAGWKLVIEGYGRVDATAVGRVAARLVRAGIVDAEDLRAHAETEIDWLGRKRIADALAESGAD